jgi:hypothetical protein
VHGLGGKELEGEHLEGSLKDLGALARLPVNIRHAPLDGQKEQKVAVRRAQNSPASLQPCSRALADAYLVSRSRCARSLLLYFASLRKTLPFYHPC